jgi:hypothetical protein
MAFIVKNNEHIRSEEYPDERSLSDALERYPALLMNDGEAEVILVHRELTLPRAGRLDLLFVDSDGMPIAVEVKLDRNAQAQREVIGQALDYLSDLTSLTVDELNKITGGKLEASLRALANEEEEEDSFNRLWETVGTNLRAGKARLVVALDRAPQGLERIFRFLAEKSNLDVQLIVVQHYGSNGKNIGEKIFVPVTVVNVAPQERVGIRSDKRPVDWDAVITNLNNSSLANFIVQCKKREEKLSTSIQRIVFPREGISKWRVEPRKTYAWVMQGGRFTNDLDFWTSRLSDPGRVTVHRNGKRLHFILKTTTDFDHFLEAVYVELVEKSLIG